MMQEITKMDQVLLCLAERSPMRVSEIARKVGIRDSVVSTYLSSRLTHLVQKEERGVYSILEAGKKKADSIRARQSMLMSTRRPEQNTLETLPRSTVEKGESHDISIELLKVIRHAADTMGIAKTLQMLKEIEGMLKLK